jgi:lactate racemase
VGNLQIFLIYFTVSTESLEIVGASVHSYPETMKRFAQEGFRVGPHKAYQIARDSINRRVIWITELPNPEKFLLETAPTLDEAVMRVWQTPPQNVCVIPYANSTIPKLQTQAQLV